MTIGFIGLGDQGAPIAGRILAGGFPLQIWDLRPERMEELVATGAVAPASLPELAAEVDVASICVANDAQLRDVLLGCDGILHHMGKGKVVMVHTTAHPDTVSELEAAARMNDIALLDAPVSGGHAGAKAGTMTLMIGGDTATLDRVRPVLATFASKVVHLGPVGSGQIMKLLNNGLHYANLSSSMAALEIARELGIDEHIAADVISTSSGNSFALGTLLDERRIAQIAGDTSLVRKDINHFLSLLSKRGIENRLAVTCGETADRFLEFAAARRRT